MKNVLTEMTYDELPTFVMVEKLFCEYRNVKRRHVIVATLSMFTTARLSSHQLTLQLTVNQRTSRSYSHPMCYFPLYVHGTDDIQSDLVSNGTSLIL